MVVLSHSAQLKPLIELVLWEVQKGDPVVGLLQPDGLIIKAEMERALFSHAEVNEAPGS